MSSATQNRRYTPAEEWANTLTHGVGTLLAVAGLTALLLLAARQGSIWHTLSFTVFGITLIFLYLSSTLYHISVSPRHKAWLRVCDHVAILLLIAGTYTPFTLITLHGPRGWALFMAVWSLAVAGIFIELSSLRYRKALSIALYLAMGWLIILAIKPLLAQFPLEGFWLLLAGGLAYTLGVGFYLWHGLPYHHAIWHLWVFTGSACHFFAILLYVVPQQVGG